MHAKLLSAPPPASIFHDEGKLIDANIRGIEIHSKFATYLSSPVERKISQILILEPALVTS